MKLVDNQNLIDLAYKFERAGVRLYVVGGFVRDRLLGISEENCTDIDLCSMATVSDLEAMAVECDMLVSVMSRQFGVAKIYYNGKVYEHATLRSEECSKQGSHYPTKITFETNINKDYLRRDFTASALYYDIYRERIEDFCGGVGDIESRILRAVGDANVRIMEDAERILRAIRFKISYGFEFDDALKNAIKNHAELLYHLNDARKYREIIRILLCDEINGNQFDIFDECGVLNVVFPSIYDLSKNCKNDYKNVKNALKITHIFKIPAIIAIVRNAQTDASDEELNDINKLESFYCKNDKKLQNYVKIFEFFTKKHLKTVEIAEIIEDNVFDADDLIYCARELYSAGINRKIIKKLGVLIKS